MVVANTLGQPSQLAGGSVEGDAHGARDVGERFANGVVQLIRGQPANPQATLSDVTAVRSPLLSGGVQHS